MPFSHCSHLGLASFSQRAVKVNNEEVCRRDTLKEPGEAVQVSAPTWAPSS